MNTGQLFLNQGDGWFSAQTVSSGRAIPSAGATTDFTTLGLKVSTNAPNKNGAQNPLKVGHVNFKAEDSIPGSWWSGVEPDVDKWGNKYIKKDTYWQVDFTNGPFFVPSIYYVWYCKEAPCDADYPHALVQCKNPYSQEWKTYGKYIIGGETQGEDHHAPTYQVGINSVCDSVRIIKEEIPHTAQGGMPGHGGRPFGLELFNVQLTKLETTFNFELNDLSPGTYEYKCGAFAQTHKSPDFPYYDLSDETRAFTVNWYCKEPNCNYNNESCYSESYIKPDDNTKICRQAGWVNRCGDSFCDSSEECGVCVSDCGICPVEGEPILNFKFEDDFEDGQGLFKLIREHTYGCCTNTDRFVEGVDGKALATETKAFGIDCLYPDSVICKDKLIKYTIEFDFQYLLFFCLSQDC